MTFSSGGGYYRIPEPDNPQGGVQVASRMRIVLICWIDGDVEDCDEVRISAETDAEAIRKAKARWRVTIGAEWPHCRIIDSKILTTEKARGLV